MTENNQEEKINIREKLEENISMLENKEFNVYFFTMDTKGNPSAGVANVYEHVKILRELGYNAHILHEKNDYVSVGSWLGEDYANLPHASIEAQQLKVNGSDFVIIPEIFANVMEQIAQLPCKRIVLCQSYDYIFEMLQPGKSWLDYNFTDCITTTEKQKEYLTELFSNRLDINVVPVGIPSYFKPTEGLKKPVVSIYTRDQRDTVKIYKTFYLKYPHLKWVSFRDMRGMNREQFAKNLSESCLSVWVDDISGFGTFPLEAMKSNVPVVGKIPNMVPDWMDDKNGIWVNSVNNIPDIVGKFVQAWLEDMDNDIVRSSDEDKTNIYDEMSKMEDKYTMEDMKTKIEEVYGNIFNKITNEFKTSLNNLPVEEAVVENKSE
jgi:hypothetical protein